MIISSFEDIDPLTVFKALCHGKLPFIFSEGGYSYLGADPIATIRTEGDKTRIEGAMNATAKDPFTAATEILSRFGRDKKSAPFAFNGGLFGYLSYDLKNILEPRLKKEDKSGLEVPLAMLGLYDPIIVVEEEAKRAHIVTYETDGYKERGELLTGLINSSSIKLHKEELASKVGAISQSLNREEYISLVKRAKEYIEAGDIYQINISMRFTIPWQGDPFELYSSIRSERPSRYGAFIDCGDFQVILNSPERFLKVADNIAETEPIKGTRPRGKNRTEDEELVQELKKSEKERAEHVMIVDLERNDIGRFSKPGSVRVEDLGRIESLPGLHHMVSTIKGNVKEGLGAPECLRSAFPGGSITGTPKIRAMEIIEELETLDRGVYTGAVGFIDLSGEMDTAMAIRTAVYKDSTLYISVGSGIVADSDPSAEYEETVLKAEDFLNAVSLKDTVNDPAKVI